MPVKEVTIKLNAKDESEAGFRSFTKRLRDIQREQRASGEGSLEKTLKGGGVVGLYVLGLEAANVAAKSLDEGLAHVADGSKTIGRSFRDSLSDLGEHVPVVSTIVEFEKSLIGIEGTTISLLQQRLGVTREIAEANAANGYRLEEELTTIAHLTRSSRRLPSTQRSCSQSAGCRTAYNAKSRK